MVLRFYCVLLLSILVVVFANKNVTTCSGTQREVGIINNCNYKIWIGAWWNKYGTPQVGGDGYLLTPGDSFSHCIPEPFDGRFWARTNCKFDSNGKCPNNVPCCDSGNCIDSSGQFAMVCGQPGVPPATLAEFNMIPIDIAPYQDYYDVSMVDGSNIPMQIVPIPNTYQHKDNAYHCGTPGCTGNTCDSSFNLKPCTWKYDGGDYTTQLMLVSPTKCQSSADCFNSVCDPSSHTCRCGSSSDCKNGEECGSAFIPGVGLTFACGTPAGWYSAGDACALNPNLGEPLGCNSMVDGQGTRTNLYECTAINSLSCLSNGALPTCCGCPPWEGSACKNSNEQWVKYAQPAAEIFKSACPTAYSYPYDDAASTFTCSGSSSVGVGYTITFCPRGSPGSL